MKVSEFIEFLKKQDQDAIVQVLCHDDSNSDYYTQGGTCSRIDFDDKPDSNGNCCIEFIDFTDNQFVNDESPIYGKKYLLIGKEE